MASFEHSYLEYRFGYELSMSRFILFPVLLLGILITCNAQRSFNFRISKPIVKPPVPPSVVYVEVLCVVDYTTFKLHGGDTAAIKNYFAIFWNEVNKKFKILKKPEIRINLAGVYILQTEKDSAFSERNRIKSLENSLDCGVALDDLGKFIYEKKQSLPNFDIVVAVTNMNMFNRKKDGSLKDVLGLAIEGGACQINEYGHEVISTAIIEDSGAFSGIQTALHEMSHLLDASHDDEPGQEKCNDVEGGFIMESVKKNSDENQWEWSSCSINSIRNFTSQPEAACLHNVPIGGEKLSQILPGGLISLDEQCKKRGGVRPCYPKTGVCSKLYCTSAEDPLVCVSNFSGALDGSPCGPGQYCLNDKCVVEKSFGLTKLKSTMSSPDVVYLEILCIVDDATFKLHGSDTAAMNQYFLAFFNDVDSRFKSLDSPQIRVHLAGVIPLKMHESTFLEKNRFEPDADFIDGGDALRDLSKFLYLKKSTLPNYDIAIVITKSNLGSVSETDEFINSGGRAFESGACQIDDKNKMIYSAAIVQDSGYFDGVRTVVKNIGLMLNAPEDDSVEAEDCDLSNEYIMGPQSEREYQWKWSSCSKKWISYFLKQSKAACLYNVPRKGEKKSEMLPGKVLSLDKQCERMNGGRSCKVKDSNDVCHDLFCTISGSVQCITKGGAAQGSPCETGSICMFGRCVKN